mmetsp:Transcript_15303/g.46340  ORF Transcript_15303/g.46340 Transcript_15303/m.46340 type:complete len:98 (+) Transcript_15303:3-296(+)
MVYLNRKMRGALKKLRREQRGYMRPSRVKYFNAQKKQYKQSYAKVQKVLAHIELERQISARVKRESKKEERMRAIDPDYDKDEYFDAILEGRLPPEL